MGMHFLQSLRTTLQMKVNSVSARSDNQSFSNRFSEEILIDFHELLGEHSGDNMADAVWETLEKYGLVNRVFIWMHLHCI